MGGQIIGISRKLIENYFYYNVLSFYFMN